MKKTITRERQFAFRKDIHVPQNSQGISVAKHGKPRSKSADEGSSQRKLPNFLAKLEQLGYTESEGAAFLKQFAHDAVH